MKRLFILATAAIVALASCSKTQVVYTDAPEEISFKQVTNAMTKAPGDVTTGSLGVVAHQGDTEHFPNTEFAWDEENDVFTSNEVWPREGTLDFTVYYPYNENASYAKASKVLTIPGVAAADVLYYGDQRFLGKSQVASVPVTLKHICAKITVAFNGNGVFDLTGWTISGVNQTGTVTVNYTANESPVVATLADPVPTTGDLSYGETAYYVLPGVQTTLTVNFKQGSLSYEEDIDLSPNGTEMWVANTQYNYTIAVGAPDKINFTASVGAWAEEDPTLNVAN